MAISFNDAWNRRAPAMGRAYGELFTVRHRRGGISPNEPRRPLDPARPVQTGITGILSEETADPQAAGTGRDRMRLGNEPVVVASTREVDFEAADFNHMPQAGDDLVQEATGDIYQVFAVPEYPDDLGRVVITVTLAGKGTS